MLRQIIGFGQDTEEHWYARLTCGHRQHVRHDPPLVSRPWVLSDEERYKYLGTELNCARCDDFEWPEDLVWMKDSNIFDHDTIPAAITKEHQTSAGVWGRIVVHQGNVGYRVMAPCEREFILTPESPGIVLPEVKHCLIPSGPVTVQIRFYWVKREDFTKH